MNKNKISNGLKFLITGGAGFIGSHIAEKLIKQDRGEVVVFDNLSVGQKENIPQGCQFIQGDIRNKTEITKAIGGVDIIFHDAAFVSIRKSFDKLEEEFENNCLGTLNVLRAAEKNKVKKIIFASSMAVYGQPEKLPVSENHKTQPNSPYGLSKLRGEIYCQIFAKNTGLKYTILRYFNTYGIKQTPSDYVGVTTIFINQALNQKPMTIFGDGKQTRDFVWVEDIAEANLLAAFSDKQGIYNIGSGNQISINELAVGIKKELGGEIVYQEAPGGEIDHIEADISKAQKELAYQPKGDFFKILPEIIKWWQENKYK